MIIVRMVQPAFGVNQGMGVIAAGYALTALAVAWVVSRTFSAEVSLGSQAFEERGQAIPPDLLRSLRARTPTALRTDQEADWGAWPGLAAAWKK